MFFIPDRKAVFLISRQRWVISQVLADLSQPASASSGIPQHFIYQSTDQAAPPICGQSCDALNGEVRSNVGERAIGPNGRHALMGSSPILLGPIEIALYPGHGFANPLPGSRSFEPAQSGGTLSIYFSD